MGDQTGGLLSPFLRNARIGAAKRFFSTGLILDYGCGIGALAYLIPSNRYLGIDLDQESLAVARRLHPGHSFSTPDQFSEERNQAHFSEVIALAFIEHLEDPGIWMRSMKSMLMDGGILILTTPNPAFRKIHGLGAKFGIFSQEAAEDHKAFFGIREMRRLARDTGLSLAIAKYFLFGSNQLFVLEKNT